MTLYRDKLGNSMTYSGPYWDKLLAKYNLQERIYRYIGIAFFTTLCCYFPIFFLALYAQYASPYLPF